MRRPTVALSAFIKEINKLDEKVKKIGSILSGLKNIENPARSVVLHVDTPYINRIGGVSYSNRCVSLDPSQVTSLVAAKLRYYEKLLEDREIRLERMLAALPENDE